MSIQKGRFMRTVLLITLVTAVFLLTGAQRFGTGGQTFPALVVGVGIISLVTAITSFLISANEYLEEGEDRID
jgi:ABC-type enterobactin transport system permease subunit